uniref:Single-stranded DNA endonuclease n=1 Tax=Rhodopseudomonas palustris (strain DX-1) TaxID=652103 RepID=E6VPS9_RHOPX
MILLTDNLRDFLLANGRQRDVDHVPVVKFFNPLGEGVWLATELDADGDTLFGLADIGYPELGSFSLEELTSIRLPFGRGIERDILFTGDFPISVWAEAAREAGSIRAAERILYRAAQPSGDGG